MKDRVWNRIYDILISSNSYYLAKKLEAAEEREQDEEEALEENCGAIREELGDE